MTIDWRRGLPTREGQAQKARPSRELTAFLRFVDSFGGQIPADAPLVNYQPSFFSAAVAKGYLDGPTPNLPGYRLTPKACDLLKARPAWQNLQLQRQRPNKSMASPAMGSALGPV